MPIETDEEYFQSRVALERQFAAEASTAEGAAMHEAIARGYEVLVWMEQRARLRPLMTVPLPLTDDGLAHPGKGELFR